MEIWGHRGAYHFAPENTLTAFQIAADMGADGVEFDIQMTRDGEIVIIHDEKIDRTSTEHGYVKDFSLSELKKINFNKRGITQPAFIEMPTLAETFELLRSTNLKINVELKTSIVFYEGIERKAFELAVKYDLLDRIVWSSFNHYSVQKIKELEPAAETGLLCGGGILITGEQCEKVEASALHLQMHQLKYPELIEDCRKRGVKVRVYTVNEPDDFKFCAEQNVDGVFTNRIDLCKNNSMKGELT
jgi:glycerophosphoryl diester phosphodiesterase